MTPPPTDRNQALRDALEKLVNAKALKGVRDIVAGWNGENRPDGPYSERHPSRLGATLPKTTCGAVYELDEAMQTARTALAMQEPASEPASASGPLRFCEYCKSWNDRPCGNQCVWTPDMPISLDPALVRLDTSPVLMAAIKARTPSHDSQGGRLPPVDGCGCSECASASDPAPASAPSCCGADIRTSVEHALIQASGALKLDTMVGDDGKPYGTTTVALDAIADALDDLARAQPCQCGELRESLLAGMEMLRRAVIERDPGREILVRINDLATEVSVGLAATAPRSGETHE